jgi:four helix bundle protein
MKIERFEDIESWKEARNLVKDIYAVFRDCKDYGFKDQIQRAAVSVMTNISEGFDRGTNKETTQFLTIARGSLAEVRSLTYAAQDIGYLSSSQVQIIFEKCDKIKKLLNGFITYLRKPRI